MAGQNTNSNPVGLHDLPLIVEHCLLQVKQVQAQEGLSTTKSRYTNRKIIIIVYRGLEHKPL